MDLHGSMHGLGCFYELHGYNVSPSLPAYLPHPLRAVILLQLDSFGPLLDPAKVQSRQQAVPTVLDTSDVAFHYTDNQLVHLRPS